MMGFTALRASEPPKNEGAADGSVTGLPSRVGTVLRIVEISRTSGTEPSTDETQRNPIKRHIVPFAYLPYYDYLYCGGEQRV